MTLPVSYVSWSTMPIALYAHAAWRHWRIVTACAAFGAFLLGFAAWQQPAVHRSDVRLVVAFTPTFGSVPASTEAVAADIGMDRRVIEQLVRTYTQKTSSPTVLRAVIASLGLPYSVDELAGTIRASTPLNTTFIDISVTNTDPQRAAAVSNALAGELRRRLDSEKAVVPAPATGKSRIVAPHIVVLETPTVSAAPVRLRWQQNAAVGLLGGLVLGVGFATLRLVLHHRGDTVRGWLARVFSTAWTQLATRLRALRKRVLARFWGPGWL